MGNYFLRYWNFLTLLNEFGVITLSLLLHLPLSKYDTRIHPVKFLFLHFISVNLSSGLA